MKVITLDAFDVNSDAQPARLFNLLYQAVFNDEDKVGPDKQAARRLVKIMDRLDEATEEVPGGRRVKSTGLDLLFEEAEFTQLQALWEAHRARQLSIHVRDVVAVDDALEGARSYTTDEWVKQQLVSRPA